MPKRGEQNWRSRAAWGLTSGVLAFSLLTAGGGGASTTGARSALAEDIDCYNDKDLYNLPECVERRNLDKKGGMPEYRSRSRFRRADGGVYPERASRGSPRCRTRRAPRPSGRVAERGYAILGDVGLVQETSKGTPRAKQ